MLVYQRVIGFTVVQWVKKWLVNDGYLGRYRNMYIYMGVSINGGTPNGWKKHSING